jgi:glyceraldehyde 3-phosphate dehydrogenase
VILFFIPNFKFMPIRLAINGFGRIGRNAFKVAFENKNVKVIALNDLAPNDTLAHLLRHDTVYGDYEHKVRSTKKELIIHGEKIPVFEEKDPSKLPWRELGIDVVLECTGFFRTEEGASKHLSAGAKRVIVSAPGKGGNVPTYVRGVNNKKYKKSHKLINNASCTTNCVSPVASVMQNRFGIKKALMSTVHGYTSDQKLQDGPHKDLRRARAAAVNIIPTTTGAAIATTEAIPALRGKFDGMAIRVPVPVVSLTDFTFLLKKKTTVEQINKEFEKASKNPIYRGIIGVTKEPLVSSDFIGDPRSAIVDLGLTKVVDGDLVKVVAWYDNEWGYSNRLVELAVEIGKK